MHSSNLKSSSSSPNSQVVGLNSIIKKSQTRVRKTLEGKPEFVMSLVETQNVLGKFDKNKATFVVLHVDLVGSTKLAMMLPMDRLTKIIQAFNQEMSLAVKAFGGHILKYVGDAVLAFFVVVTEHKSEAKVACINAINCANYMLRIAHEAINPILRQYGCPEMNLRIGVDIGENAIIQSGWDIHPNIRNRHKNRKNTSITNHNKKRRDPLMKKAVYDVLSYTLSIAVKMTAFARPNHLVIGDPVYTRLDHKQRSAFQRVHISPDIWDYVCKNSEVNIYDLYTNV